MEENGGHVVEAVSVCCQDGRPLRVKEDSGGGCAKKTMQKTGETGQLGSEVNPDHKAGWKKLKKYLIWLVWWS